MKVHFLTTMLSGQTGGSLYDGDFFNIVQLKNQDTKLFDDQYFLAKTSEYAGSLKDFNHIYRNSIDEILSCDILFMNSRLYTRFVATNLRKAKLRHPNTKIITIHHHSNYMNHNGLLSLVHRHFEMDLLRLSDNLIIPNEYIVDSLQLQGFAEKIVFLPSSFERTDSPVSSLESRELLFVGTVERRKGLIYALRAFSRIAQTDPSLTFRIVGKYDEQEAYYKKLKKFVEDNGLHKRVIFEGRVDSERLDKLYSSSVLFVFPSLLEGYGWVMVEAMSHGVPVVAFDNSAMPYTVKNNYNGRLVGNKDWEDMAQAIKELLADKEDLLRLQKGALATFDATPTKAYLKNQTIKYLDGLFRGDGCDAST